MTAEKKINLENLIFRQATESDVTELHSLVNSAYRGDSSRKGWTTEAHLLDGQRTDPAQLGQMLKDPLSFIYLAVMGEEILACVQLRKEKESCYLGMLSVRPVLQNAGIGRWMIDRSEDLAKGWGYQQMSMTVITLRGELFAYYERRGYKRTGILHNFHTDPAFGIPKQPLFLERIEKNLT